MSAETHCAVIFRKFDFGNATLPGIPAFQLDRLEAVMNAAARPVFQSSQWVYVTPLLRCLHWLCASEQITYKFAILVYQHIRGLAPAYLADALQPVAQIPRRQWLHSSSTSALFVPPTCLCKIGDRAFMVAAADMTRCAVRSDVI